MDQQHSVFHEDIPAYALVVGVPGRVQGWVCRCGVRLPDGAAPACPACGARYREILDAAGAKVLRPEATR